MSRREEARGLLDTRQAVETTVNMSSAQPRITTGTFNPRYFTRYFTKNLALACGLVAISTFNYAFDQQGFNSTQAMDSFSKTFGYCAYSKKMKKVTCQLDTYYLSLLNSLVYVGFAFGMIISNSIYKRVVDINQVRILVVSSAIAMVDV